MTRIKIGKFPDTGFPIGVDIGKLRTTTYTIGIPASGKSTFLGNLAEQFSAAGEGVLVVDIKGDLTRDIASRTARPDNVVYVKLGPIDFNGTKYYWTVNPFYGHKANEEAQSHIRSAVIESFERMGLAHLATMANINRTITTMTNAALSLDEPTYWDLHLLVVDREYRQQLVEKSTTLSPVTRRELIDLDSTDARVMSPHERRSLTQTTRTRLYDLLNDPIATLTCCWHKSSLNIPKWLDEGKMVLVDLGMPLTRETGVDLGNLIMSQLLPAIQRRPQGDKDRIWRIVVDEFHLFVGKSIAQIITERRSENVFMVLAHQTRGQLAGDEKADIRSAVSMAGLSANFLQSREDRIALAAMFGQEAVDDFYDLKPFQAIMTYYSRLEGNTVRQPVLLQNWWGQPVDGQLERIIKNSRKYTIPRSVLTKRFEERYGDYLAPTPNRDRLDSDGNTQSGKEKQKSKVRSEQATSTETSILPTEQTERPPRPGRRGSPRAIDQFDDSGSDLS